MNSIQKTIIALLALVASASAFSHSGKGTAYSGPGNMDGTGQNMCEFDPSSLDERWQNYYAAMNQADWEKAGGMDICGKCIAVRGVEGETTPGHKIKTVIVKVVDQCPDWACDPGNVDFSTLALQAITGFEWDKKDITWDFVDCNSDPDGEAAKAAAAKKAAAERAAKEAAAKRAAAEAAAKKAAAEAAARKAAAEAAAERAQDAAQRKADIVAATADIKVEADQALDQAAIISSQVAASTTVLDTSTLGRRLSRRSLQ